MVDADLLKHARRAMYQCRLYDPAEHAKSGIEVRLCADCGRGVAVTTAVLTDRMQSARDAGVTLHIVCDECGVKELGQATVAIVEMPSEKEMREANAPG